MNKLLFTILFIAASTFGVSQTLTKEATAICYPAPSSSASDCKP